MTRCANKHVPKGIIRLKGCIIFTRQAAGQSPAKEQFCNLFFLREHSSLRPFFAIS